MSAFALARSRAFVSKASQFKNLRFYTGPTIEYEHLSSGWSNVEDIEDFKKQDGKYSLQTFNKISPQGLATFPKDEYDVEAASDANGRPAMALMLRSHKLQEEEVGTSVRCIARCGAGTNNIRKSFGNIWNEAIPISIDSIIQSFVHSISSMTNTL